MNISCVTAVPPITKSKTWVRNSNVDTLSAFLSSYLPTAKLDIGHKKGHVVAASLRVTVTEQKMPITIKQRNGEVYLVRNTRGQ